MDEGDEPESPLLSVLLDQLRFNFRVLRMLVALSDGEQVSHEELAQLAEIVAAMSEAAPKLARELRGFDDER